MDQNEAKDPSRSGKLRARAAEVVGKLSRPGPNPDLVARTLARIAEQYKPVKQVIWCLRPITNPIARILAAAAIVYTLTPMTDMDLAVPIGSHIEEDIIGRQGTDKVEVFVDNILVRNVPAAYPQTELDALMGVQRPYYVHKTHTKSHPPGV